jgi:cobalamin biosynthesis protein CbiG
MPNLAIVALSPRGAELGRRLAKLLRRGEVIPAERGAALALTNLFREGRSLVCIMALGIVVRALGPLARDKRAEPPVVVVDEAGQFAVSVLGGHTAGANALAREVAQALGAVPVITTASEALGVPAVDLIGRCWGWKIEPGSDLTAAAAAVVRGEPVAVYQDAGRADWWQEFGDWPASFQRVRDWPEKDFAAALLISDRLLPTVPFPAVMYRPRTLVVGVGCRRGVPCAEIEDLFLRVFQEHRLATLSLYCVATATLKSDEPGLLEFAAKRRVPLRAFSLDELARTGPLPTPSEAVRARIGIAGVAEPAALLAVGSRQYAVGREEKSGDREQKTEEGSAASSFLPTAYCLLPTAKLPTALLVPKQRSRRVTLAVARREEA